MNASGRLDHLPTQADTAAIIERAATARQVLGPERDLAIDFHGRVSPPAARRLLPLLEPFHPLFVEEPVLPGENHAALAETFGAALAPHCPLGPLALAACLQVDFATPNFLIQEQSLGIHYNQGSDLLDYLLDPSVFAFHDGFLERTERPGLGVDIDEDAVRAADALAQPWRTPVWRHPDGSFAEW